MQTILILHKQNKHKILVTNCAPIEYYREAYVIETKRFYAWKNVVLALGKPEFIIFI